MYALAVVLLALFVAACAPEQSQARSFDGTWKSSDGMFVAKIENNRMSMHIHTEDLTALYWRGTFKPGKGNAIISYANRKALEESILGSEDRAKTFIVKGHELRFHFQISGVDKVVSLRRA